MKNKKIVSIIFCCMLIPSLVWSAQKTLTKYTWDSDIGVTASGGGGGPFDPPGGLDPIVNDDDDPIIVVDPETGIIEFLPINDGSGAIWYQGTTTGCNPCNIGRCTFGVGFRAYFEFRFTTPDTSNNSTARADGFTFNVVNASNNDTSKRGGFPNSSGSMGELLGYAGSGNTSEYSSPPLATEPLDGLGLEPPKFAIEFDTYPSTGGIQYDGCSGGRQDNDNDNHIAVMFWGNNPNSNQMCHNSSTAGRNFPRASFDDNIHRAGDGSTSNPYNSAASGDGAGLGGYYERERSGGYNWLEDGQWHRVRVEVIRTISADRYQIKAWVDCETLNYPYNSCSEGELIIFQNVLNPYDNGSYLPKIDRTQQLSGAYDTMLNEIFLGFTVGTGGATQGVQIRNFAVYFPTASIDPTSRTHTYSAASGQTISVTAAAGTCAWTAVSNNPWITITGGASGTGNGTVTYSITANSGAERTGTITVGGQTFTIIQNAYTSCSGYRVWNETGSRKDFRVTGEGCESNLDSGDEITDGYYLNTGETVDRYDDLGYCSSSRYEGSISFTDAQNADLDGDCQVNYLNNHTVSDR
ncbi:MAG TPA: hypothetical protein P5187_10260 [Smithellaceae bacterium]|nr:hypothetical protein [Smithellaceae bacterium]HRT36506.1 hypothetical protein [Smithellaceae bacterium]HRU26820.1 hypothetical protein [Smithellaceae bacterium]